VTITYVKTADEPFMAQQFGISGEGYIAYKPKRAKYVKSQENDLNLFIESVLGGGGEWEKIENANDNGLMFKEFVEKKDEL
jgi:hypothetical protein